MNGNCIWRVKRKDPPFFSLPVIPHHILLLLFFLGAILVIIKKMWNLEHDWYSPKSLLSTPTHYDFPVHTLWFFITLSYFNFAFFFLFYLFVYLLIFVKGDRFIPNRSLMDLDQAHSLLTNRTRKIQNKEFNVFSVFIP